MSYQTIDALASDPMFGSRVWACMTEQAETFKDDARPDIKALANLVLRADGSTNLSFVRMEAAGPGIADKVDNGDGTVDQSQVTDADVLGLTQSFWPVVAELYFDEDGRQI
jgi:hypothetical protein